MSEQLNLFSEDNQPEPSDIYGDPEIAEPTGRPPTIADRTGYDPNDRRSEAWHDLGGNIPDDDSESPINVNNSRPRLPRGVGPLRRNFNLGRVGHSVRGFSDSVPKPEERGEGRTRLSDEQKAVNRAGIEAARRALDGLE